MRYLTSCFVIIRSNNFENTDRLEIGRNDLGSAGSRSAFFSKGLMYADRNEAGTTSVEIDALIRQHINGANSATLRLRSHVGKGLDAHCLSGRARISSMTSDSDTGEKTRSSQTAGAGMKVGEAAPAVAARTPATLSSKNW